MESTRVRTLGASAMLVGGKADVVAKIATVFEQSSVRVVKVAHTPAAGERLAVVMPQVVVALDTLTGQEREDLTDRATAVGALVMYIDPALDDETMMAIVERIVDAAVQRKIRQDLGPPSEPSDDDVE